MRRFTSLYDELDRTTRTTEKSAALARYFREAPAADAAWALHFLTGGKTERAVSSRVLRRAAENASGYPAWLIDECYAAVGDGSETLALLLKDDGHGTDEPLHGVVEGRMLPLAHANERDQERLLIEAWRGLDSRQRYVFHKLLRGGFRVGVDRRLVVRGLAEAAGIEPRVMEQRLAGTFKPSAEAYAALISAAGPGDDAARPYPFFLAHQLDGDPAVLGDAADWFAERKWDGIRAQLIRRAGAVTIWSRGEEIINTQFPEVEEVGRVLPDGTVLDGEVLMWRGGEAGQPLAFAELQTRLNRKVAPTQQASLFDMDRAVFLAFDLLESGGVDQRTRPFAERRERLETLARSLAGMDRFVLSRRVQGSDWALLARERERSREVGAEGLMLKHRASPYGSGRLKIALGDEKAAGWVKWKVAPYSVDAVLVYAQPGSGRRAGLYTDYTFAVWADDPEKGRVLTPFAKAYSGLNNDEIERVDAFVRRNSTDRHGPVRMVEPRLVFEIAFEDIRESTRHRGGVAVRFPRIARWRHDKKPEDADTLDTLRRMLRAKDQLARERERGT